MKDQQLIAQKDQRLTAESPFVDDKTLLNIASIHTNALSFKLEMTYKDDICELAKSFPIISDVPDNWNGEIDFKGHKQAIGDIVRQYEPLFTNIFSKIKEEKVPDECGYIKNPIATLATKFGLYFHYAVRNYDKAIKFYNEALNLNKDSPVEIAKIHIYIGNVYETKGKYNDSLREFEAAKKILPDIAEDKLITSIIYERLAATHENLYQTSSDKGTEFVTQAKEYITESLKIYTALDAMGLFKQYIKVPVKKIPEDVLETLSCYAKAYNTAAGVYELSENLSTALTCYKNALIIRQKLFSEDHLHVAYIHNNIGLFYHSRALNLREAFNTNNYAHIKKSVDATLFLCKKLGIKSIKPTEIHIKFEQQAQEELEKAAAILSRTTGDDIYGNVLYNLGLTYKALGDRQQAKEKFEAAKDKLKELHPNHINVIKALNSLALIYKDEGNTDQATKYYREALVITKEIDPEGNSYITETLHENIRHLEHKLIDAGDLEKLEELYKEESINRFDCMDSTSLIYTTSQKKSDVAQKLVEWNADPFLYNRVGVSAFSEAFKTKNEGLAKKYFAVKCGTVFSDQYNNKLLGDFSRFVASHINKNYSALSSALEFNEHANNECYIHARDCSEALLGYETDFSSDNE